MNVVGKGEEYRKGATRLQAKVGFVTIIKITWLQNSF